MKIMFGVTLNNSNFSVWIKNSAKICAGDVNTANAKLSSLNSLIFVTNNKNLKFLCFLNFFFQKQMIGWAFGANIWKVPASKRFDRIKKSITYQDHFKLVAKIEFGVIYKHKWHVMVKRNSVLCHEHLLYRPIWSNYIVCGQLIVIEIVNGLSNHRHRLGELV